MLTSQSNYPVTNILIMAIIVDEETQVQFILMYLPNYPNL